MTDDSPISKSSAQKPKNAQMKIKRLDPIIDPPQPPSIGSLSIQCKQDMTEASRRMNPASLSTKGQAFWDVEGNIKIKSVDTSDLNQQLNIVENGVNYSARRFNDLKIGNDVLTKDLKKKLEDLEEQKKIFENLDAMKKDETEESARIAALKEEIVVVDRDIKKRVHYGRKLEHMLSRLKRNQLKFDGHMFGMEQSLSLIQKEHTEIILLRRSLDVGLGKAVTVRDETRRCLATARKDREVMLDKRRRDVGSADAMEQWRKRRDELKAQLVLELRGDLTVEEERFMRQQIDRKIEQTKQLQKANEESTRKLQAMEDIFAQLKQVTGVSSLEEMFDKFSGQRSNKRDLESDVKDAEARLAAAKKHLQKKEQEFQSIKSGGTGAAEVSRDVIARLNNDIAAVRNGYKLAKASEERLANVLLSLQQGVTGLAQRVIPFREQMDVSVTSLDFSGAAQVEDGFYDATLQALSLVEQVLAKMMEITIGNAGDATGAPKAMATFDDFFVTGGQGGTSKTEFVVSANNIRVKSHKMMKKESLEIGRRTKDEDDMVISRQSMEAASPDEADVHASRINLSCAIGAAAGVPIVSSVGGLQAGEEVLSRVAVKKSSDHTMLDAKRKEDTERRQKRLKERMALGKSASGDDIDGLAAYKAQRAAADRLCTTQPLASYPEGITIRDDIMRKTESFLKHMPDLT